MKAFHLIVRGCPVEPLETRRHRCGDFDLQTLVVPSSLQSTPLPVTFDQVADRLAAFDRLHVEPDGSFVWVSPQGSRLVWQVDGNLYDRGDSLNHVEVKGTCPPEELKALLGVLGGVDAQLMLEHVPLAVFITEDELQKLVV